MLLYMRDKVGLTFTGELLVEQLFSLMNTTVVAVC